MRKVRRDLYNHHNLSGNKSKVYGNAINIYGNVTNLSGDVTNLIGNVDNISGKIGCIENNWTTHSWGAPKEYDKHYELTGDVTNIWGEITNIYGNCTHLRGNVSGLSGDISLISGLVDGVKGRATNIFLNLDNYSLTNNQRIKGIDINVLSDLKNSDKETI